MQSSFSVSVQLLCQKKTRQNFPRFLSAVALPVEDAVLKLRNNCTQQRTKRKEVKREKVAAVHVCNKYNNVRVTLSQSTH